MKKVILAISLFLFLFSGISFAYNSGHIYINGRVDSIQSNTITVGKVLYKIDQRCKVVVHVKENNAFHERPARLGEVNVGDVVTAKMIGGILYEIIIERWR